MGKTLKLLDKTSEWFVWQPDSFAEIRRNLTEFAPEFLGISCVSNARLWTDVQAMGILKRADAPKTAGELKKMLKHEGIEPEAWWALEKEYPYHVHICWSEENNPACYDVLFQQ